MPRRPRHLLPLSMVARSDTGHDLILAVERTGPPGSPYQLILQTGMVRLIFPPAAAEQLAAFMADWWPPKD